MSRSRWGTSATGSPPSSASTQKSVWGAVGRHETERGPSGTPWIGTSSATGREAIGRDQLTSSVPHLDLAGEAPPGHLVGPGTDQALDEEVLAVWREIGRGVGGRRAYDFTLPVAGSTITSSEVV